MARVEQRRAGRRGCHGLNVLRGSRRQRIESGCVFPVCLSRRLGGGGLEE